MMSVLVSLVSITLAAAAPQLPAGLTAAACPNYPYCDGTTGFLEIPDVPGAEEVIRAQEQLLRANLGPAAEVAVLFAQGRAPANLSPAELQHYQAEQAVLA